MAIYIGIEGIGMRRCAAVAADETGAVLGYATLPHGIALHAMPRDILQSRLKILLQGVAKKVGKNLTSLQDTTICIGLTGVTFSYDAEIDLPSEFDDLNLNIGKLICTGDAEIVIASHVRRDQGASLVCHMGSSALVARGPGQSNRTRIGGWGPVLGDEGSGYWIGRAALRLIGEQYDAGHPAENSPLWNEVVDWLKNPDPAIAAWDYARLVWSKLQSQYQRERSRDLRPAIFAFAHEISRENPATWRDVASGLVTPVMRAAFDGDDTHALTILEHAADHLCAQLRQAFTISEAKPDETPTVLYGGVLTHNKKFREMVIAKIHAQIDGVPIVTPDSGGTMRPVFGALLFALGGSTSQDLALPGAHIIDRLTADPFVVRPPADLQND